MKNINEIANHINNNVLPFQIEKTRGKVYKLTNTTNNNEVTFKTVSQVVNFLESETERLKSKTPTIKPQDKQGAEALKIDPTKLIAVMANLKAPVPSKVKDKKRSEKYSKKEGGDDWEIITKMIRDEEGKRPQEIKEVQNIRTRFKNILDKYCLNISINGCRVVSVHHRNGIKTELAKLNDELHQQANVIKAKLGEWKELAIKKGSYIEEKWPSEDYFSYYGVRSMFCPIDDSFDFKDEVSENAVEKIRSKISDFVESLSSYFQGEKTEKGNYKRINEKSISNLCESAQILLESGIISDEKFNGLCQKIVDSSIGFKSDSVRAAKEKLDKGIVVQNMGKGRKSTPVNQQELDECKEFLEETIKPFQTIAEELEGLI